MTAGRAPSDAEVEVMAGRLWTEWNRHMPKERRVSWAEQCKLAAVWGNPYRREVMAFRSMARVALEHP